MSAIPNVAIACQGGGSHAAFAAGVLTRLFQRDLRERFHLVGLSGTSGGAMCAALAWSGLASGVPSPADEAIRRLQDFWRDLEARDLIDAMLNFWSVWLARAPVAAEISPYTYEPIAEERLRALLTRHLVLPRPPSRAPALYVGATDVENGERVIFDGSSLSYDALIASAAVPPLFRAVKSDGHLYWDGLFSTNPPVREFTKLRERPNEIWVVQINPQKRAGEPRTTREIVDRRNELAGNLSLAQELYFIQRINDLLKKHASLREDYQHIDIRIVELGLPDLDYQSKLDRSGELIEALMQNGRERAPWFFEERSRWPRADSLPVRSVRA